MSLYCYRFPDSQIQIRKGRIPLVPAAFRNAVNFLAFTTAFTAPVSSSKIKVVAGSPPVSSFLVGTDTTFIAVFPREI